MSYLKTRLKKFGLTLLDYYTAHRCGVCMEEMSTCHTNKGAKSKHIDHDHDTGRFRGFLCHSCNVSLGAMKDDPIRLRRAANYLERAAC